MVDLTEQNQRGIEALFSGASQSLPEVPGVIIYLASLLHKPRKSPPRMPMGSPPEKRSQ